ncbi:hypothetical protein BN1708_002237 [Verticillium longisporum]|uniref:Protein kinase domain-containing protein n=1 Tax=Verticillium longisporum TaxID=100787 RepID=A0A0G4KLG5_VERLO|nr:hypothetical protein BN1708_002237 [Verticillium longisporum]
MADQNPSQSTNMDPTPYQIPSLSPANSQGNVPTMSSPVPLLRPAIPGARSSGARAPRLGLAIPPSPNAKPVGNQPAAPAPRALPTLHLATPMGSQGLPYEQPPRLNTSVQGHSASGGSESSAAHSRSGSFGPLDGRASNPTSAGSQYSALSFASQYGIGGSRPQGTPDPVSAVGSLYSERSEGGVGMERDNSLQGLEQFDKLSLEKARSLDVEDLDDDGWRIASLESRIEELGNLGEGAGGAVTRAKLKGGKTVFALKVITTNPDPDISEGVLRGLTYLHGRRIIHRDIKPSNILLCRNGEVKLCDFGVSGDFGTKGEANTFIGTSYYMAPERITGQSYTITSDVWSTGVTLLEVAQHRFPFPADGTEMQPRAGLIDLLTYIVRQPIPKLKDEPDVTWSDNFKYFIECCLEKDPTRRASPWRMLDHPWMVEMRSKRVNMEKYLSQVWGWDTPKAEA